MFLIGFDIFSGVLKGVVMFFLTIFFNALNSGCFGVALLIRGFVLQYTPCKQKQ